MAQSDDLLKEISQKLNVLIALQMVEEKPKNIKDKIKLLDELGASTLDIADILNISPNHAAKERSLLKKDGTKTI